MIDRAFVVLGYTSANEARACWVVMLYADQEAAEAHAGAANAEANRINNTLKRVAMLRGGPAEPALLAKMAASNKHDPAMQLMASGASYVVVEAPLAAGLALSHQDEVAALPAA